MLRKAILKFGITSYLMEDNYFLHQKNHPPVVLWSRTAFFFFVSSSKSIFLPGKRCGSNLCCSGCVFMSRRVHRSLNDRKILLQLLLTLLWGLSLACMRHTTAAVQKCEDDLGWSGSIVMEKPYGDTQRFGMQSRSYWRSFILGSLLPCISCS